MKLKVKKMKKIELKEELIYSNTTKFDVSKFEKEYSLDEIIKVYTTKSSTIRYLYSENFKPNEIYSIMKTKYPKIIRQHIHNVINQYKNKLK